MTLTEILKQQFRALFFLKVELDPSSERTTLYAYLLFVTLIVGVGRYWDHPNAGLWQYMGLGSVTYVFVLSGFLYLVVLPLKPPRWSYSSVFTFVGFTSLPALLYAIPVERYMSMYEAQSVNAWFLAIVATWRVALYVNYLGRGAGLQGLSVFVATLLPLTVIIVMLASLNLEHVVFQLMSGNEPGKQSQNDTAYAVVYWLSLLSFVLFPITLVLYAIEIYRVGKGRRW